MAVSSIQAVASTDTAAIAALLAKLNLQLAQPQAPQSHRVIKDRLQGLVEMMDR